MVLFMSRPQKHPKTGIYRARKVVPSDLRELVGKRELIETLGTKDPAAARRLHPEALTRFDNLLAAARARLEGRTVPVTPRQIAEMAGEVYRQQVQLAEADPETVESRELGLDLMREELAGKPSKRRYREAETLLSERGILADPTTVARLARAIVDARLHAEDVGLARARGDWSPDRHAARYPLPAPLADLTAAPNAPGPSLTTAKLLDLFVIDNPQKPKTMVKREAAMRHLEAAAGHDDASRITKADVRTMKSRRQGDGVNALTIVAEFGSLRAVWSWAINNELLPEGPNPFAGMNPKAPKQAVPPRLPFTQAEAGKLLIDARTARGGLRWLVWLLALTGCRLEEACGARAADIRQERGVWILDINEASTERDVKGGQGVRMVPLHPALVAEGFLAYARALPQGSPLFPDMKPGAYGKRSSTATKKLGRWLRLAGVTDPRKVGAHSWRHWVEDRLRFARVPREATDGILGHVDQKNAGDGYGVGWRGMPDESLKELVKIELPPGIG